MLLHTAVVVAAVVIWLYAERWSPAGASPVTQPANNQKSRSHHLTLQLDPSLLLVGTTLKRTVELVSLSLVLLHIHTAHLRVSEREMAQQRHGDLDQCNSGGGGGGSRECEVRAQVTFANRARADVAYPRLVARVYDDGLHVT